MIEIERDEKVVCSGTKEQCISFLRKNGLPYLQDDEPLLILGSLASLNGFSVYLR